MDVDFDLSISCESLLHFGLWGVHVCSLIDTLDIYYNKYDLRQKI